MRDYKIGDEVAISLGVEADPFKGEVVAVLDLPGWMFRNYVVSLETEMDPLLEVRNALNMSPWDAAPNAEERGTRADRDQEQICPTPIWVG